MKKLTIATLGSLIALCASASPISPEQALQRLESSGQTKIASKAGVPLKLAYTAKADNGQAAAYIFTPASGAGFTILSADDIAVPVLGYSNSEVFDATNMPPALKWWLEQQYSRIEYGQKLGISTNSSPAKAPAEWRAVEPLLQTTWNQDAPYNGDCPQVNGVTAPTGCVAVSFAQVMNYFKYPQKGEGSITYLNNGDSGARRTMTFSRDFDWDNMLDKYVSNNYTSEQASAVSYLMKACGYSTEMMYSSYASGTQSWKIVIAAQQYFNYDKGSYFAYRDNYSADQWAQLVYDNIAKIGPVIYNGQSIDGGHSFVCDGYDGNGYFHFNWGWGGLSDGYFVLDSLNPDSQGIGGSNGGYNYLQSGVFALQPPTPDSPGYKYSTLRIYGSVQASIDDKTLKFTAIDGGPYTGWGNGSYRNIKVGLGVIITNVATGSMVTEVPGVMKGETIQVEYDEITLDPNGLFRSSVANPVINLPSLPDGEYKVTLAAKDLTVDDSPWTPFITDWGTINYCYLKVNNGQMTVSSVNPAKMKFDNAIIDTPLYSGRSCRLKATITNDSDVQLTKCIYPALSRNGVVQYVSDYMLITVEPHQTIDVYKFMEFMIAGTATDYSIGNFTFQLYDADIESLIADFGEVEMKIAAANTKVQLDKYAIEGAPQATVTSGTRTFKDAFIILDPDNINLILDYTVVTGYFDTYLRVVGSKYDFETGKYVSLGSDIYAEVPFLGQGDSQNLVISLNDVDFDPAYVYSISAGYSNKGNNQTMGSLYLSFDTSGVDKINSDSSEDPPVYYNLQGVKIENPQKGQLLIKRTSSRSDKIIY